MLNNSLQEAWIFQQLSQLIDTQFKTPNSEVRRVIRKLCSERINTAISEKTIGQVLDTLLHSPSAVPISYAIPTTYTATSENGVNDKLIGDVPNEVSEAKLNTHKTRLSSRSNQAKQYTLAQLAENPTLAVNLRPVLIRFSDGKCLSTKYWADLAVYLVEWLSKERGFQQIPFKVTEAGKNYFINNTPNHSGDRKMTNPTTLQVSEKTVYMETCQNTAEKLRTLVILMRSTGADPQTVKVDLV